MYVGQSQKCEERCREVPSAWPRHWVASCHPKPIETYKQGVAAPRRLHQHGSLPVRSSAHCTLLNRQPAAQATGPLQPAQLPAHPPVSQCTRCTERGSGTVISTPVAVLVAGYSARSRRYSVSCRGHERWTHQMSHMRSKEQRWHAVCARGNAAFLFSASQPTLSALYMSSSTRGYTRKGGRNEREELREGQGTRAFHQHVGSRSSD